MNSILIPFILCLTAAASVGLGLFAAYASSAAPSPGPHSDSSQRDEAADAETARFDCLQVPPGSANTSPSEVDFGA